MDEGLPLEQVLWALCVYDNRYPTYGEVYSREDDPEARSPWCGCDSCFHGKDKLAIEILRLRALLESTRA